jgi:hypothetical protein
MATILGGRLELSGRTARAAAVDAVCIALFILAGELRHGIAPLEQPLVVVDTAIPFYTGWLLAALAAGAYAPGSRATPRRAVLFALLPWTAAVAIAQALRATALFHGNADPAFAAVSLLVGGSLLAGWRLLATEAVRGRLRAVVPVGR